MQPIVSVDSLTKTYKTGHQKVEAVRAVSFSVQPAEFVVLNGTSGSGKSTLLQLIGGLDKPTSGSVSIDGKNLNRLNDRELSKFRGQMTGFVFQFFYLQPFLSLQQNIEVPGMFTRIKPAERQIRTKELAEVVGLGERLEHLPKELSGGQIQRVAIARALLNRPKIVLADEPTGNLDSQNSASIIELFEKIRRKFGTTIIVATHDTNIAAKADRALHIKDGAIA